MTEQEIREAAEKYAEKLSTSAAPGDLDYEDVENAFRSGAKLAQPKWASVSDTLPNSEE